MLHVIVNDLCNVIPEWERQQGPNPSTTNKHIFAKVKPRDLHAVFWYLRLNLNLGLAADLQSKNEPSVMLGDWESDMLAL